MSEQTMPTYVSDDEYGRERSARPERRRGGRRSVNVGNTERFASAVAGGFLAIYGVRRRGWLGAGMATVGAELVRRSVTGHCVAYDALGVSTADGKLQVIERSSAEIEPDSAVNARAVTTIMRPREELYAMWRDFSQLPRFMDHLQRVDVLSSTRSHWVTKGPAGTVLEWDAEIVEERENEYIAWRSVDPAEIPNRGTIQFLDAPAGRGTEVMVTLDAEPPAGKVGNVVARLFGASPQRQVSLALKRFKQIAEVGEIPTVEGQSSGRASKKDEKKAALSGEKTGEGITTAQGDAREPLVTSSQPPGSLESDRTFDRTERTFQPEMR